MVLEEECAKAMRLYDTLIDYIEMNLLKWLAEHENLKSELILLSPQFVDENTQSFKKVIVNEKSETKVGKILKFSEDKNVRIKNIDDAIYFEPEKSVYNRHFLANKFEEAVNIYLVKLPDVKACIKNMGFIKIPYQNTNGIWSSYIPDFFIKLSDSEYCVLETKGAEYLNDPIKKNALEAAIKKINENQKEKKFTNLYVLQDKFEKLANKPSTFKMFYEVFKEIDIRN